MSATETGRANRPAVFLLHFLGGSAALWSAVTRRLEPTLRCVPLDLAGFGRAADKGGYTVAEMADAVVSAVRAVGTRRWLLAGHSMGAKVAAVVARRAEDGEAGLGGLAGLMLLAGSPPGPEPMQDAKRQEMLGWFAADADTSRVKAERYIDGNAGPTLDPALREAAIGEVLGANRAAWTAWLEHGSREDWSERVGVLRSPTLALSGAADAALGPPAQRAHMAPHFADIRLMTLADAGHLLPLERPDIVARLIASHAAEALRRPMIHQSYQALIGSGRVSARTRAVLLARAQPDAPDYRPAALDATEFRILRAVVARVVPQADGAPIDLAARIDGLLAAATGDGWRFADLPNDAEAYQAGLATLEASAQAQHGHGFTQLDGERQDDMLRAVAAGELAGTLDGARMRLWFEDVRSDAVRAYVAHPATLARIGYSGIGYGGDGEPKPGFVHIGAGERDAWEPALSEAGP